MGLFFYIYINVTPPSGYEFDNSRNSNYSSNYKIITYDPNTVYSKTGAVKDSNDNNNSNLNLSNVKNDSATLNGKFTEFKSDSDSWTGSTDSQSDWLVNAINIPIKVKTSSDTPTTPVAPSTPTNPTTPTTPVTPTKPTSSNPVTSFTYTPTSSATSSNASISYYSASSSVASSASNSIASSSSSSSTPVASSAVNNYYKMYNHKTQLVKSNNQVQIYIEPKYAADDANGSLANQYVVSRTDASGKVSHDQLVTLDQYNAMLSASGKQTFTSDSLDQSYQNRQHLQGVMRDHVNKTTFDAKVTKQGNDTLIDTSGNNYGFNQPADKQMVLDTDDLRVPVKNNKPNKINKHKKNHKIKVKAHHHAKKMKHMKMTNHINHKHHANHN